MCIARYVEMKSVFTFYPIKRLIFTTVNSAKRVATFLIIRLRAENREFRWLAVMVHIVLQERRVATTKENHLHFWRNLSDNTRNWTKESKSYFIYGIIVSTTHWFIYNLIFYTFSLQSSNMIFSVFNEGFE